MYELKPVTQGDFDHWDEYIASGNRTLEGTWNYVQHGESIDNFFIFYETNAANKSASHRTDICKKNFATEYIICKMNLVKKQLNVHHGSFASVTIIDQFSMLGIVAHLCQWQLLTILARQALFMLVTIIKHLSMLYIVTLSAWHTLCHFYLNDKYHDASMTMAILPICFIEAFLAWYILCPFWLWQLLQHDIHHGHFALIIIWPF